MLPYRPNKIEGWNNGTAKNQAGKNASRFGNLSSANRSAARRADAKAARREAAADIRRAARDDS